MKQQNLIETIRRLNEAAELVDGCACVRASDATAILGERYSRRDYWERQGWVRRVQRPETAPKYTRGYSIWYPLADVERLARGRVGSRHRRAWRDDERAALRQMVGRRSLAQMARALRRKPDAVVRRMKLDGLRVLACLESEHGLVSTGRLAQLVRHTRPAVVNWAVKGMPHERAVGLRGDRGEYVYDLRAVRAWLATRPGILVNLHPDVRRLLRLSPSDLETIEQQQAA